MLRVRSSTLTKGIRLRNFHGQNLSSFQEVQIPVPWGHISGKWWGDRKQTPVLAIHDFRQNCCAFDHIIPKMNLPSIFAIDLPGHGQSSHFPRGRFLSHLDFVVALRYLTRKLPIGQYSFLGHGFGSLLALVFAAAYNKQVKTVLSVECSRHVLTQFYLNSPNGMGEISDRFFEIETVNSPVELPHVDPLSYMKATEPDMSEDAANTLVSRLYSENSQFMNDPRYEFHVFSVFTDPHLMVTADHLKCKLAMIRNKEEDEWLDYEDGKSRFFDMETKVSLRRKGVEEVRRLNLESSQRMSDACRYFEYHEVRTSKHILLDTPDMVAGIFNGFLEANIDIHQVYSYNNN